MNAALFDMNGSRDQLEIKIATIWVASARVTLLELACSTAASSSSIRSSLASVTYPPLFSPVPSISINAQRQTRTEVAVETLVDAVTGSRGGGDQ